MSNHTRAYEEAAAKNHVAAARGQESEFRDQSIQVIIKTLSHSNRFPSTFCRYVYEPRLTGYRSIGYEGQIRSVYGNCCTGPLRHLQL